MTGFQDHMRHVARFAAEVVAETLWPTRCALCDALGAVLCGRCAASLPHIDWWRACRRCGSPFGLVQCDACSTVALERLARQALPFSACASAVLFGEGAGRIVRVFKDQGEQRLSSVMAMEMARVVPPDWRFDEVTYVPATLSAVRYRGFDHAHLIADDLSGILGVPCACLLDRPRTRDQRSLNGMQRIENLAGRFKAVDGKLPDRVLLVDDVYTTGATVCAATDALRSAGCETVYCLTFARV